MLDMERSHGLVADTPRVYEALPDTTPKRARSNGREVLQHANHPGVNFVKVTEIPSGPGWKNDDPREPLAVSEDAAEVQIDTGAAYPAVRRVEYSGGGGGASVEVVTLGSKPVSVVGAWLEDDKSYRPVHYSHVEHRL